MLLKIKCGGIRVREEEIGDIGKIQNRREKRGRDGRGGRSPVGHALSSASTKEEETEAYSLDN